MNPQHAAHSKMGKSNYPKFFLMLAVSFVIMHLTMYLNTEQADHLYLSTNRLYMTTLMISTMAVVMLLFMRSMYPDGQINILIIAGSVILFGGALFCVRNQVFIDDKRFMQSMIPHHSIAILVSKKADLKDAEVKALANSIIEAQEREIAQMKRILARMSAKQNSRFKSVRLSSGTRVFANKNTEVDTACCQPIINQLLTQIDCKGNIISVRVPPPGRGCRCSCP